MTDYIEVLLAGQEEQERTEEPAELETGPAVIRLESADESMPGGSDPDTARGALEMGAAAPLDAGAAAPAEAAVGAADGDSGAASGAEALWPALADTKAVVRRTAQGENGALTAEDRDAAGSGDWIGAALQRSEGTTDGGGTAARLAGENTVSGGTGLPGAAWLSAQVGRSLAHAAENIGRNTQSVTVIRPAEQGGGTWEAESLDRLFRRDARRYDGGFQLL